MTTTKTPVNPEFLAMLATLTHNRTDTLAADLIGVPVHTLRKWSNGTRAPNASAVRLVAVLATLATIAPDLLAAVSPALPATAAPALPDPLVTPEELEALIE
jgi:predicted transporter